MRTRAAVLLSAAMAISMAWFVFQSGLGSVPWQIVSGLVVAVLLSAVFGYRLGAWYCPVDGERPGFELVFCPVVVYLFSSLGGSASAFAFFMLAAQKPVPARDLAALPMAIVYGTVVVWLTAWPAIVAAHVTAAWWLARWARSGSAGPS